MKKILMLLVAIIAISSFSIANAALGGFQDTNSIKSTVEEALKMNDNSYVTLQGTILRRLSNEDYLFKDQTGSMTVEIDSDKWLGQYINPNDQVEISGEIERKFNSVKLDVETIKKIK